MNAQAQSAGIAIVGMSVLLPKAPDLATYWRNLQAGTDAITEVPAHRWDPLFYEPESIDGRTPVDRVYCRRGGFADEYASVAVTRFGIPPAAVAGTEPDQLIALSVAAAAVDDAGGEARLPDRERIGVVLGRGGYVTPAAIRFSERVRSSNQLVQTLREVLPELDPVALNRVRLAYHDALGPFSPENAIGLVSNLAASRLANRLDLRGPAYTVDGACASSLIAVDHAVSLLLSDRCDMVLAGGVHHCHDISFWSVFAQMRALSPSQQIKPFDRTADGTLIGEGTGVVVLKRLADAERDGDRVYAVIRGVGVASDGRSTSLMNPDSAGQTRAVRQAWRMAGLDPAEPGSVGLIEAHGTATPAGDTAEVRTMATVFGSGGPPAVIGSVKSMIGHTMPTAGVAGLIKATLAVYHGVLPPTLHCADPHPGLAETRFQPIGTARPWETTSDQPMRRAGVNAFGFGGINAHVVIEEASSRVAAVPVASVGASPGADVLRLTADSHEQLARIFDSDDAAIRERGLTDDRTDGEAFRIAVADPDSRRLSMARRIVAAGEAWRGRGEIFFSPRSLLGSGTGGRLALVFPGVDIDFRPRLDDIAAWLGASPIRSNTDTAARHGQSVLAVGLLLDRALRAAGVVPDVIAGCSLGEWNALMSSGALDSDTAERFFATVDPDSVRVPNLVFAAVGLGVRDVLDGIDADRGIVVSHDNAPSQSIVCGPAGQIRQMVENLRGRRIFARELPFRSGFHTPMFAPFVEPFRQFINTMDVAQPTIELWSATTATPYNHTMDIRELFLRHLVEPVRFQATVKAMYEAGCRAFVQVGLGQLPMLIGETLAGREHLAVAAGSAQRNGMIQLRRALAALWTEGYPGALPGMSSKVSPKVASTSETRAIPLDLGSAMVSFGAEDRRALRQAFTKAAGTATAHSTTDLTDLSGPIAAEFQALLDEMSQTSELARAAASTTPGLSRSPTPTVPSVPAPPLPSPPDGEPEAYRTVLRVDTETMPYLLDHCFFRQRPDWPDESDRRPVVPAMTIVRHITDIVESAASGRRVVELRDLRLLRWLAAAPPVDVPVTLEPAGPDEQRVTFGEFSTATVTTASAYPDERPPVWKWDADTERTPSGTAAHMYQRRLMFHGPAFQGVTELTAMGPRHIRGLITAPSTPGALLDCAGQILGYWVIRRFTTRTRVLPIRMGRFRFYGPHPAPGTLIACHARIVHIDETIIEADIQLTDGDRVWAEISGWLSRRFDNHPETQAVESFPEYRALSREEPGGWMLLFERWTDLASRDLVMRNHLNADERAEYDSCPPLAKRHWLLGRIAAKDAVRTLLWAGGEETVFPAEIRVSNDPDGRPYVAGMHGRALPELVVSIAHCAQAAVAIVRTEETGSNAVPGVGIDIEEVLERPADLLTATLAEPERALLADCHARTGEPEALWFTRFWTAKEAVAKAEGTGLEGRPKRFRVHAVDGGDLLVTVKLDGPAVARDYRGRVASVKSPEDLPAREYVVAWTA